MAGEGEERNDVTLVKAESLRFAEFPHRVPNASFHTPAPHTVAGHPSKNSPLPPPWSTTDVRMVRVHQSPIVFHHTHYSQCVVPAEKSKMTHREKTTIMSCFANDLRAIYGNGNLSYRALLFFTVKEVNLVLIQRQTIRATTRSYIKAIH